MMNLALLNPALLRETAPFGGRWIDAGRIYLTQGSFGGQKIIRFQVGQFDTTRDDVMMARDVIQEIWEQIQ